MTGPIPVVLAARQSRARHHRETRRPSSRNVRRHSPSRGSGTTFSRYHGNRWTSQATAWIPIEWWDACQGPLDEAELVTLECAAGLDLAQKWDLACFAVVFRKFLDAPATPIEVIAEETQRRAHQEDGDAELSALRPAVLLDSREHDAPARKGRRRPVSRSGKSRASSRATEGDIIDYTRIYQDITTTDRAAISPVKAGDDRV